MIFDELGIVAAANYLSSKGEMTRAFFYLMSTQKTAVRQLLLNKVIINHALMSSITQLRPIYLQFLEYVHSLKSDKKVDISLAIMHVNFDDAMAKKVTKGVLDIRYAQFSDARKKTESKLMNNFSTQTLDDQWNLSNPWSTGKAALITNMSLGFDEAEDKPHSFAAAVNAVCVWL